MAQLSVKKEDVNQVIAKITVEGGKLQSSKLSADKKEVVLIYIPGEAMNSTEKAQLAAEKEKVMVNGPEGLKPIEGTILTKPKVTAEQIAKK